MKTYKLKVMYLSSNNYGVNDRQFYQKEINASGHSIDEGMINFLDKDSKCFAMYPVNCTIIENIKEDE